MISCTSVALYRGSFRSILCISLISQSLKTTLARLYSILILPMSYKENIYQQMPFTDSYAMPTGLSG